MKRKRHFVTAVVGVVGIVLYTICAMVVKQGFANRGAVGHIIYQISFWFVRYLRMSLFQKAFTVAGIAALLMVPMGLVTTGRGKGTRVAGCLAGVGLLLFGAMMAVYGVMYYPFFKTLETLRGGSLYTTATTIYRVLLLGVLLSGIGGLLLGIFGFLENRKGDTLLQFLQLSMAIVFAVSLIWQLLCVALSGMYNGALFVSFSFLASMGLPFVLLAAVHVRGGMLEGRG